VVASVSYSAVGGSPPPSSLPTSTAKEERVESKRQDLTLLHLRSFSFLKKVLQFEQIDRPHTLLHTHRDVYLVTGLADCIVITVLNILHRARELTNSAI